MDMMFLSSEGIETFKTDFSSYSKHYQDESNQWFMEHWQKLGHLQKSKLELPDISFCYAENMTSVDKENTIAVHSALRSLSPSQASDERLWSSLCHTVGWEFIKKRRGAEMNFAKPDKNDEFLMSIFFFKYGIRRSCYLNALAKYWWTGHMVYDPSKADPYAALDVLCKYSYFSSLMLYLSSSGIVSNYNVFNGVVESFGKLQQEGIAVSVDVWKETMKFLNGYASTVLLDALSKEEITALCDKRIPRIISSLS